MEIQHKVGLNAVSSLSWNKFLALETIEAIAPSDAPEPLPQVKQYGQFSYFSIFQVPEAVGVRSLSAMSYTDYHQTESQTVYKGEEIELPGTVNS